jgi:hypothetical protein
VHAKVPRFFSHPWEASKFRHLQTSAKILSLDQGNRVPPVVGPSRALETASFELSWGQCLVYSVFISITNRYRTSFFTMRSYATLISFIGMSSTSDTIPFSAQKSSIS